MADQPYRFTKQDLQQMAEYIDKLKEIQRLKKQQKALTAEEQALHDAAIAQHGAINHAIADSHALVRQMNRDREKTHAALHEELEVLKRQQSAYEKINTSGRYKKEVLDSQIAVEQKQLEILLKTHEVTDEEVLKQKEKLDLLKEQLRAYEEQLKVAKELGKTLGEVFAVYEKNKFFNVENAEKLAKAFKGGGQALKLMAKEMAGAAFRSYVNSVIGLVFQLDKTEAAFKKATGASQEFAASMRSQYKDLRIYGVTLEDVGKANEELFKTFTDFTMYSEDQRNEIAKVGATLSRRGVDFKDYATGIQIANKALGQTGPEATQLAMNLEDLAVRLGRPPKELAAEWAKSSDTLAKLGKDGPIAFKRLAIAFKVTGIEIQKIIKISDAFDTFEGAATRAGQLNAALGGNFVNAMDLMMETDPVGRFQMIQQSLKNAGLEFDSMGYYQKKFIAESAGLEGPAELAMLMSGNFDAMGASVNNLSQAEFVDLQKRAAEVNDVQTKMTNVLQSMILVVEPLVDVLQDFTQYLVENERAAKELGVVVSSLIGLWLVWKVGTLAVAGATALSTLVMGTNTTVTGANNAAKLTSVNLMGLQAAAMAKMVPVMLAMGAAALMMGLGIGIAALGIAEIAKAFAGLGDAAWPAAAAIIGFTFAFVLMVALMAKIAPVVAVAGTALLYLGGAIALIGAGLLMSANSLVIFNEEMKKVGSEQLVKLMNTLKGLETAAGTMRKVAQGIEEIAVAIDKVDPNKTVELTTVLRTIGTERAAAPTAARTAADENLAAAVADGVVKAQISVQSNNVKFKGPTGTPAPIHTTVDVFIDKDKLGSAITKLSSKQIEAAINNRGTVG